MDTNQIYELVNSVTQQAFGNEALTATDARGLISLGDTVLSSQTNTEAFLNVLVQRIGRTIYHYRAYRNKLRGIILESDMEWGAIMQKIDIELPEAVQDDAYELVDGQSIDPWIISKPKARQKLFVGRNPYMFKITISRKLLKEAFLSETALSAFVSVIFGKVRNMIEASYEDLARTALCSAIGSVRGGNIADAPQRIPLGTMWRAETGSQEQSTALKHNKDFLAWAVGKINLYSDYLTDLTALYNDKSIETFTPKEDQRLVVLSDFERRLETVTQWQAFHDGYVKLNNYETINFWQSPEDIESVKTTNLETGAEYNGSHIIAALFDRDALGVYQMEEEVLTTNVNPRGLYYNTFYHVLKNMFFDRSENFLVFTLN